MRYIEGRCYICSRNLVSKEKDVCSDLCEAIKGLVKVAVTKRLLDEGFELEEPRNTG